jgi:D-alanyl-D-alanine carboxypeptidase/D-alanyl-D-alanine-endopeptidase (penicillin-binding protein 4)
MASLGKMKKQSLIVNTILISILVLWAGCKSTKPTSSLSENLTEGQNRSELGIEGNDESRVNEARELKNIESNDYSVKYTSIGNDVERVLRNSPIFSSHFTGFSLYDIRTDEYIVNHNADKYFTPASNVKILTLYAALKSFGKQLPTALYTESDDTLFVRPIGDPTFLHPQFQQQNLLFIMRNTPKPVSILWPKSKLPSFGIGWMWDDYNTSYQPELSWMPIYGNVANFSYTRSKITATPSLFEELVEVTSGNGKSNTISRAFNHNYFKAEIRNPNWSFDKAVPFKYSQSLAEQMLQQATNGSVTIKPDRWMKMDTLYSVPTDTVLRKMMQESDNFISEQLLIMSAWKNGFDNTEAFREYMAVNWLPGMDPIWIDGSGLSRYNLIRPVDKVKLLTKMYEEFGWARIHNIFAKGGVSGTIKDWYPNRPDPLKPGSPVEPYIIAKTGSLANNHNLSGYMQTKSGRLLVFSFMNNNFVRPSSEVKKEMQNLLEKIRDAY